MKLSPEKQKNLTLAILGVVIACFSSWYFLINQMEATKTRLDRDNHKLGDDITKLSNKIKKEQSDREQAKRYSEIISKKEQEMPPKGNPETWLVQSVSEMAAKLKIQQLSGTAIQALDELSDYRFKDQPYKLVGFRLEFKAEINQLGRFIEEIENRWPLMEVEELSIVGGSELAPHIHTISMRLAVVTKI